MLLLAIAFVGIMQVRRSVRLVLLAAATGLGVVAAALNGWDSEWSIGLPFQALPWIVLGLGGAAAAMIDRPVWICAVVGPAALATSRMLHAAPTMAGWVAALHLFAVAGLVGAAAGGFGIVASSAPQTPPLQRSRWAARISAVLLLGLLTAAVVALLVPGEPLGLTGGVALLVLPAEAVAGLCVWRAWEQIAGSAAADRPTSWATWAGVLAVFAMAGVGLAVVPVILWAGER